MTDIDTSPAALEALAEQWRMARGAMPSSSHEYINGLLTAGERLAATLHALAAERVITWDVTTELQESA